MVSLAFTIFLVGFQALTTIWALVASVRERYSFAIAASVVAGIACVFCAFPFPHVSLPAVAMGTIAGMVVIAVGWRRSATLAVSSPVLAQAKAVMLPFLAVVIFNTIPLVGALAAAATDHEK